MFGSNMEYLEEICKNFDDMTSKLIDPRLYLVSLADKDTLYYRDAMVTKDMEKFRKAMVKEVMDQSNTHIWRVMRKSDPQKKLRLIRLIWSFKQKRNPLGELLKHKARYVYTEKCNKKGLIIGTHMHQWLIGGL